MATPARSRAASTRATVPMLLKGLIFGPDGRPMSPTHTRRRGRTYRYYVSRTAIEAGYDTAPVTTVPAGDVEAAVLARLGDRQPPLPVGAPHGQPARVHFDRTAFSRRADNDRLICSGGNQAGHCRHRIAAPSSTTR
jgi:hypothetical protein